MFCLYLLWIRLAGVWRVTGASRDGSRGWWQLTFRRNHFSFSSAVSTALRSAWGEVCDASSSSRSLRCRPRNCNMIPENSRHQVAWLFLFKIPSYYIYFFSFWYEMLWLLAWMYNELSRWVCLRSPVGTSAVTYEHIHLLISTGNCWNIFFSVDPYGPFHVWQVYATLLYKDMHTIWNCNSVSLLAWE